MGDNGTYLESFIENVTTLPSEIRRNLELMKDLDRSCSTLYEQMCRLQEEYVNRAEEKVLQLELAPMPIRTTTTPAIDETATDDNESAKKQSKRKSSSKRRKDAEKEKEKEQEAKKSTEEETTTTSATLQKSNATAATPTPRPVVMGIRIIGTSSKNNNNNTAGDDTPTGTPITVSTSANNTPGTTSSPPPSSKKRSFATNSPSGNTTTSNNNVSTSNNSPTKKAATESTITTPTKDSSSSPSQNDDDDYNNIILPTTEELANYFHDAPACKKIKKFQQMTLQQAEEKLVIAKQTYKLIDSAVQRLDSDILSMEKILQSTGEFYMDPTGAGGVAGAGGALMGGMTGAGAGGAGGITARIPKAGDLAAIQVTSTTTDETSGSVVTSDDWILAKIITYDPNTGMYQLSDEDVESNKIFHLPESQVIVLGGIEKLSRGDIIFAVYPDTTSFYQATVVSAPRRTRGVTDTSNILNASSTAGANSNSATGSAGGVNAMDGTSATGATTAPSTIKTYNENSIVTVHFIDDSDEHGITHDKPVLMKHVMLPPYGVQLK